MDAQAVNDKKAFANMFNSFFTNIGIKLGNDIVVPHRNIISKTIYITNLLYLISEKQYVHINELDSELMKISAGVIVSPLFNFLFLFFIYVNDIGNVSNAFHFVLFAVDTSLVSKTETLKTSAINNNLDKLCLG